MRKDLLFSAFPATCWQMGRDSAGPGWPPRLRRSGRQGPAGGTSALAGGRSRDVRGLLSDRSALIRSIRTQDQGAVSENTIRGSTYVPLGPDGRAPV
ncbi:hypothetical protein BV379_08730 [Rhodovulum sulfidophilum]|nr:hypothetical protein BV379_08730 [Rhodovulum sulfidophilum]